MEASDPAVVTRDVEVANVENIEEQSNGIGKSAKRINGNNSVSEETSSWDLNSNNKVKVRDSISDPDYVTDVTNTNDLTSAKESHVSSDHDNRTIIGKQQIQNKVTNYLDFELSSDSESDSGLDARKLSSSSASDSENEGKRSWRKSKQSVQEENIMMGSDTNVEKDGQSNHSGDPVSSPSINLHSKTFDLETHEESEQDSLCSLGNGCVDKKEAETESQNSEQSGITVGESLDQSMEEEDDDDTDHDDHLIYLEEILVRVHTDYYTKYDKYVRKETDEIPDIRKIVPELKRKVLSDVTILFSGLYPTNFPIEKTREHYHATTLGAKIAKNLVLNEDDPNKPTHLIAARAGTEKVRQAQNCKNLHIVNPDWLWSCLERWDKVEEQLFPLKDDYLKTQRENSPAMFPDIHGAFQTAIFHPTPIHPKCQPGPEVRLYDPNTGRLIRKGSQNSSQPLYIQPPAPPLTLPVHGEHSLFRVVQPHQQLFDEEEMPAGENEEAGPSKRKRQPSMSETMPLYTMCKEDLESMDKEVDDILGEGSDDSDSEKKKAGEGMEAPQSNAKETLNIKIEERPVSTSSSERSLTGSVPRGHKRKLDDDDGASESSKGSSNEDEEGSSSEADEMAAALEAELNDFM
ncbi:RNA polymerase II subunit A C-terminal domain phosphatase [Varanus komodoensis]|nr:RNA polymerase II subunit A C-terminal domain phosphatase [Varanus komodoensis]